MLLRELGLSLKGHTNFLVIWHLSQHCHLSFFLRIYSICHISATQSSPILCGLHENMLRAVFLQYLSLPPHPPTQLTHIIQTTKGLRRIHKGGSLPLYQLEDYIAASPSSSSSSLSNRGIFGFFSFYVLYSTMLHLPPLRLHCVGGSWDRTQDCCDFGIGSQTL